MMYLPLLNQNELTKTVQPLKHSARKIRPEHMFWFMQFRKHLVRGKKGFQRSKAKL